MVPIINDQKYITTELKKTLEKMIILSTPRLNNLIAIIIGIIASQSVVLSKISQELKDSYSTGTEESKIKRLQRFLSNKAINPEKLYEFFAYRLLQKYKFKSKSIYIIFDHTTIDDRFVILQFSLKVGKRAIPLWFKLFRYKEDGNKDFMHVKEGLTFLHKILTPYKFDVTILADRGFKSVDLFKFIDETLNWKYCIRCTKDIGISIDGKSKTKKLDDIIPAKCSTKYFYNVKLTTQEYICNMAVCKAQEAKDVWFIANNIYEPYAIREYKKRFDIEEMFKDFKSNGFNLEDTWTNDIHYAKMLYFCVCIAYSYIISLGVSCSKDKKNNLLGAVKSINRKKVRIYSLFTTGIKWFKRAYYSRRDKYHLKTCFTIYQG